MKNKQVVIVTGASSGIGQSTALFLSQKGYKVYGSSRKVEKNKSEVAQNDFFQMFSMILLFENYV